VVRTISGAALSFLLMASSASGQSIVLQGSAGPTITDSGYSVAAGIGFAPTSRLTVLLGVDRTHLISHFTTDSRGRVSSPFRGGTVTFATAEVRATLLRRDRVSPYVLGGFGAGVSHPHINAVFPAGVTNDARVLFVGGGLHVPLRAQISVFGDVRMVFGVEGDEGIVAFAPVRAGVAWRF
jgi:opacity protein-like surface antigen